MKKREVKEYVIGVDGGGTDTTVALADLEGNILAKEETGPSSFMKVGIEEAVANIALSIKKVLKKGDVRSTFIALAAVEENPEMKKSIKEHLFEQKEINIVFSGKLKIGSDQIAGFRSGTDERDGVVLISGTGSVAHAWKGEKEAHASGWGWVNDEGSAFWAGQKTFQAVFKEIDGRGEKTLITQMVFKELKTQNPGEIKKRLYLEGNIIKNISQLSILTDKASQQGDKVACDIIKKAANELALSANTVIKRVGLKGQEFPVVLIGGMFKSSLLLEEVRRKVKKTAPRARFVRPTEDPVMGAVKLALENI